MIVDQIEEQFETLGSERNWLAIAEEPVFSRFQAKRAELVSTPCFQLHSDLAVRPDVHLEFIWTSFTGS